MSEGPSTTRSKCVCHNIALPCLGPANLRALAAIHADPPEFVDQSTASEVLVTGIKVVDLLAPYARGGKIGLFGGAGVGKTVFIQELIDRPFFSTKPQVWD